MLYDRAFIYLLLLTFFTNTAENWVEFPFFPAMKRESYLWCWWILHFTSFQPTQRAAKWIARIFNFSPTLASDVIKELCAMASLFSKIYDWRHMIIRWREESSSRIINKVSIRINEKHSFVSHFSLFWHLGSWVTMFFPAFAIPHTF